MRVTAEIFELLLMAIRTSLYARKKNAKTDERQLNRLDTQGEYDPLILFPCRAPLLQALIGLFELPEDESVPDNEHFIEIEDTPGTVSHCCSVGAGSYVRRKHKRKRKHKHNKKYV